MNLLSVEPVVFHVFQLMLGKLKSPRNNLYPALLHIRSIKEHILILLSIELFGDLYSVTTCITLLPSVCISNMIVK